jgi:hypothetical protein
MDHTHPPHPLLLPSSLPLVPSPRQDLFYLPILHFLSVYWLFKRFHCSFPHILYFDQIYPICFLLIDYCRAPLLFNSIQCISSYNFHTQIQCISILFTFFSSSPASLPPPTPQTDPLLQSCSHSFSLYEYTHTHTYMYTHIYMYLHTYKCVCVCVCVDRIKYMFMYTWF